MKAKVILIEFSSHTDRPFAVVRSDECGDEKYYDINWCERDKEFYADYSGNGFYLEWPDNKFWLAAGHPLPLVSGCANTPANPANRLSRRPRGFGGDLWAWAAEGETVYCSICGDSLPDDDLCEHIFWDNESGWWSTPDSRKEEQA